MKVEEKLNIDANWKELIKTMIDNCNNYNDFQKEFLKLLLELYYEGRKNTIINNDLQAKYISSIIENNK